MKGLKDKIKGFLTGGELAEIGEEEYIELDTSLVEKGEHMRVVVKKIEEFADTDPILGDIREGKNIIFINVKPLAERDRAELRRAIARLKKTCQAIGGDIVGVEQEWIIVTPSSIQIARS